MPTSNMEIWEGIDRTYELMHSRHKEMASTTN